MGNNLSTNFLQAVKSEAIGETKQVVESALDSIKWLKMAIIIYMILFLGLLVMQAITLYLVAKKCA